jgi:Zn-finger nucleic acid-binding protein
MNCENCGAPLKPVRGRDFLACDYCGSFQFPPESREGVRVLGESSAVVCPICRLPLVSASVERVAVLHCSRCRGILTEPARFRAIVDVRRARRHHPGMPPRPLSPEDLARRVACPGCHSPMDVHPYYGPGNAVIDSCINCALVWLDHGELTAIVTAP